MEYVKINSLWKREAYVKGLAKGKHGPLIVGAYSEPEFGAINRWHVTEKIDGTNIRIYYSKRTGLHGEMKEVSFSGRTDDAQLPPHLLKYLQAHFTEERFSEYFKDADVNVILYGEGYGPKIQSCGGNYRREAGFIIFDVKIGEWWLKQMDVEIVAKCLDIPCAPFLGFMNEYEIVEYVKSKPKSLCSLTPQVMEGVVCRSEPLMMFRHGGPIMCKLKCKEFE